MRAAALAALALVAGGACKKKSAVVLDDEASPPVGVASAPAAASTYLDLVAELRAHAPTPADPRLTQLIASYVRSDGELDPRYGTLTIGFRKPHAAVATPPDDPSRPTGAPGAPDPLSDDLTDVLEGHCAGGQYANGHWTWTTGSCRTEQFRIPRCPLADVWRRAIAAGAPRDALAVIELSGGFHEAPVSWHFKIEDRARDIHVWLELPDDCGVVVEAGPAGEPVKPLPELDDSAVAAGIRAVRPALEACHASGAIAHVELQIYIAPSGAVDRASVTAAPDTATGTCAAKAIRGAKFPASSTGLATHVPLEL